MSITELKIYLDLSPELKSKVLDKYAKKFDLGYFFVDSEDGQCYLFDEHGDEKDISLIHEINEDMISIDIEKITIPNNIISIEYCTFFDCSSLKSVMIPDYVINIEDCAFYRCSSLTSVTIPNSVTNVGYDAFYLCKNLKTLIFKGKTIDQIKSMKKYYPFGIKDESIIKAELS